MNALNFINGMINRGITIIFIMVLGTVCFFGSPTDPPANRLTFEQVLEGKGELLTAPLPDIEGWADNAHYYDIEDSALYKVHAETQKRSLFFAYDNYKEYMKQGFNFYRPDHHTKDYAHFLFVKDGDIFYFNGAAGKMEQLTRTEGSEQNPVFSPDASRVAYTLAGNLWVCDLKTKSHVQVTRDGGEEILNGVASWVYFEEILGRRSRYRAFWWSPDGNKIVFLRFDQTNVPVFPLVHLDDPYDQLEKQRYPKPGFPNPTVQLIIARLEDLKEKKVVLDRVPFEDKNEHYLAFPVWSPNSDHLYFQWSNRNQDQLKIIRFKPADNTLKTLYSEELNGWRRFMSNDEVHYLPNGDIILLSPRSGWDHIYHVRADGALTAVTSGNWHVRDIECVIPEKKRLFFSAYKESSLDTDLYRVAFNGKGLKRLTQMSGTHRVDVSPGGSYFIDTYSAAAVPPQMTLRNGNGKLVHKLGDSYSAAIEKYRFPPKKLFRVQTADGFSLPAYMILPAGFDSGKKYPVIFSVYGGPGSRGVANDWHRGSLFQRYMAQEGFIVVSVDHRGSGHFGAKVMYMMHKNLGKWEMFDYIETVKHLRTLPYVDGERIGISGGSYGGYVTAMALTYGADYFYCGIAGAGVYDWRLYDSVYTERYMGLPKDNPEGYNAASVFTYLHKYRSGSLMVTHGAGDDNVHMQNSLLFMDKIQKLGKTAELMIFPGEKHTFGEKYTFRRKLEMEFWKRKLLPGK